MMNSSRSIARSLLGGAAVTLSAVIAVTAFRLPDEEDYYYKVNKSLETFGQVYREVTRGYVDEIDPEEFITAGINGMLGTLDPYTSYLRRDEASDIELLTSGYYGGIGITVGMRDSMVTIVDVIDGYSAQREGIRIGDRISGIEGVEVLRGPLSLLREHTRGEPKTNVRLTILREGIDEPIEFILTRENIEVHSITYSSLVDDSIGYIRLERFGANAGDETRAAILELRNRGNLRGLVLDLRSNPGGVLESAVDVVAKFVPTGSIIVSTRGRDTTEQQIYKSIEEPIAADMPLVVMVNENSASASEIVAGAVQDLDAGVILGTRSFGKGLVQSMRQLPHDDLLKLTTARYYIPSGRCIQKIEYGPKTNPTAIASPVAYRTRIGRIVYEHGGIVPDTVVLERDTNLITERLLRASAFFKFATMYTADMKSLPSDFSVDEKLLKRFEEFAVDHLSGSASSGSVLGRLNDLKEQAARERHSDDALRRIDLLRREIADDYRSEIQGHRNEIRRELRNQIMGRFLSQKERIVSSIPTDVQLQTAIAMLRSGRAAYHRLLALH